MNTCLIDYYRKKGRSDNSPGHQYTAAIGYESRCVRKMCPNIHGDECLDTCVGHMCPQETSSYTRGHMCPTHVSDTCMLKMFSQDTQNVFAGYMCRTHLSDTCRTHVSAKFF